MRILRQTIKRILLEEVCAGATSKIQKGLDKIEELNLYVEVTIYSNGYDINLREVWGSGFRRIVGQYEVGTSRLCPAYITMWTDVNPRFQNTGIGAVLYDVAVEVATKLGGYLACDRGTVSIDAKPMWRYYNASDDYEAFQMDTRDGDYTPDDPSDDCKQTIFHRDTKIPLNSEPDAYKEEFMASPFTKAYRKKIITTIDCLGERYKEVRK